MQKNHSHISRRQFLRTSAALAAASTLPDWFVQESEAQTANSAIPRSLNDKPSVALVGCGGMGRADAKNAAIYGKITVLCDIDEARLAETKKIYPDAVTVKDFR